MLPLASIWSCLDQDVLLLASIWSCLEQDVLLLASKQWLKGVRSERGPRVERNDKVENKWQRIAYTMKMLCARHLFMGTTLPAARIRCLLSSLKVVIGGFIHKKFTQTLHYCLPLNLDTTNPDRSRVRKLVVTLAPTCLCLSTSIVNPKLLSLTQRPSKASVSKRKGKEVLVTRTGYI